MGGPGRHLLLLEVLCAALVGCMEARQTPDELQQALAAAQDGAVLGDSSLGKDAGDGAASDAGEVADPETAGDAEPNEDLEHGLDADPSDTDPDADAETDADPEDATPDDAESDALEDAPEDLDADTAADADALADTEANADTTDVGKDAAPPSDAKDAADASPCDPKACDDGNPCSIDTCSKFGSCESNPAADGQACSVAAGAGVCSAGVCFATAKCGNGVVEKPGGKAEACDDGGTQAVAGCSANCQWECGSLSLGAGGAVVFAWQPALVLQAGDFTVEALVRLTSTAGDQAIAAVRPAKGTGAGWSLGMYAGQLAFRSGGGAPALGNVASSITAPGMVAGKWQHVAATYAAQSKTLRLWRNGKLVGEKGGFVAPGFSDAALRIGQEDDTGYASLVGDVAYVRISSGLRYAAPFAVPLSCASDAKTLLHAAMQGSAKDASGNALPGQTLGAASWAQAAPACQPGAVCGDGAVADWEICDDGAKLSGDGCDPMCQAESPPLGGLRDAAMVFDAATGIGWLVGGEGFHALNDAVWRFSTAQTESTWQPYPGLPGPAPRARAGLTRDPSTGHSYLFGGQGYYTLYDDLWRLVPSAQDPPSWQAVAASGPKPPPRHAHVQFWESGQLVVGLGQGYHQLHADWWAFDPKLGAWQQLTVPAQGAPAPRHSAAVASDAQGGTWMVGGQGYYTVHAEVYKLGLAGKSLVVSALPAATGAPPPLLGACAVAHDGKLLVLGGETYYELPGLAWLYDGAKWSSTVAPRKVGGVCLRRADGKVLLQLGQGYYQMSDPPWLGPGL